VLPDALSPDAFWHNIEAGRISISAATPERWRLSAAAAAAAVGPAPAPCRSSAGSYVHGFDGAFDLAGFRLPAASLGELDLSVHWVLHAAREALREAGLYGEPGGRAGLVLGNLSMPTDGMVRYAESVWLGDQPPAVRAALAPVLGSAEPTAINRFSSALPATVAAAALGLEAGSYALDAACASALYAVKLACDRLHDHSADVMVAGAVNRSDDLALHQAFSSLSALSPSGRSRPFHREADGLVPAEGCAMVTLMRLPDALAAGRRVLGVIRGIGLSNSGGSSGPLVPTVAGQIRALERAYAAAGLPPQSVSLLECHATGTLLGDVTEIRSSAVVFAGSQDLPAGSVKSNIGHLTTAAGGAALLKVLSAMDAGIRPPTLSASDPVDALRGTPLRLVHEPEPWDGVRRAGISAFGFGGNNAHLVLDAWTGDTGMAPAAPAAPVARRHDDAVAIVAIGARAGSRADFPQLRETLLEGRDATGPTTGYSVPIAGLRTPPTDLGDALGQQVAVLEAAREAADGLTLPRERTMVLVGMGCDVEVARHPSRVRASGWLAAGLSASGRDVAGVFGPPPLGASTVLGTMPNLVANRVNFQLDLAGPSFTVSADEASGLIALELGVRALHAREADAVLVGAVDLSHEPVHRHAAAAVGLPDNPGDAAVVLVLKRLADARADGNEVIALVGEATPDADRDDPADGAARPGAKLLIGDSDLSDAGSGARQYDPADTFGRPHAATGLLAVACAAIALRHGAIPRAGRPADPSFGLRHAEVAVRRLGATPARMAVHADAVTAWIPGPNPRFHVFSGADAEQALAAARAGRESDTGSARLVVLAADGHLTERVEAAALWLTAEGARPSDVAFRATPLAGEVGFVFTNGAACYPRMGRELLLAFPEVLDRLADRCGPLADLAGWAYQGAANAAPRVLDQIWGASLLSQVHTEITRSLLEIEPTAVLGYSSGESNAFVALGAWTDVRQLIGQIDASGLFTRELAGEMAAARRAWTRHGISDARWAAYVVTADAADVTAALAGEQTVHLMAVNAPGICVIGGEADACDRVLTRLGQPLALPLAFDVVAHVPEVEPFREPYRNLHYQPTTALPGIRFYSCADGRPFVVTAESAADAINAQAVSTIDFTAPVEAAWRDGVRVFIEHGPRGLCTGWIGRILGDREHLALALDSTDGHGLYRLHRVVAELIAAGVPVRHDRLTSHLAAAARPPVPVPELAGHGTGTVVRTEAHLPRVVVPPLSPVVQTMPPAPPLPPVAGRHPAGAATAADIVSLPAADSAVTRRDPPAPSRAPLPVPSAVLPALPQAIGDAHVYFLQAQAAGHDRYLAVLARAQEMLLDRRRLAYRAAGSRPGPTATAAPLPPREVAPSLALLSHEMPAPEPATGRPAVVFDRGQLEILAGGRISDVFGAQFRGQDDFRRQVRLPQPPLLLVDRVTSIDAEPGRLAAGSIKTETDVTTGAWYLDPSGRMPAGLVIEAGQADMLLMSWMGVDALNQGERVYRLLGCELTMHGSPPLPGETLSFDIHIDAHSEQAGVRLFFFHCDCWIDGELRLSVRHGQAGFFTDAELAASSGVLWAPTASAPSPTTPCDPPALRPATHSFTTAQVTAFAAGRLDDCFGPSWAPTRAHVRPPRIAGGRMLLLGEVAEFTADGGPWGRGYLRARSTISPDDWFFAVHFKDDPCMPGTLMYEGCLQAMAFYLAALGYTADADGWRFEPVTGSPVRMRCRGQVTPRSRELVYEVFVAEIRADPIPTIVADVLCTVDGVKAFHAHRVGLRLVPDWPLGAASQPVDRFATAALMASALGRPSDAFGPQHKVLDSIRRAPRLPGPPYLFMSRIVSVDSAPGAMAQDTTVIAEYDLPADAWFPRDPLPAAILLEAALQPCGWLASYTGFALSSDEDLLFRNLDGTVSVLAEVGPDDRVLRTMATLRGTSAHDGMIIVSFDVTCAADGRPVLTARTTFGFFPPRAFVQQPGLAVTAAQRAAIRPAATVETPRRAAASQASLESWDRIIRHEPHGGAAGLGRIVAERDVAPGDWYFRAHFFQDPVQPGSLGVEAMVRLLAHLTGGTPVPVLVRRPLVWKYRGQVTPRDRRVVVEVEIVERDGPIVAADAWLWVGDTRIYEVSGLAVRAAEGFIFSPVVDAGTEPMSGRPH
jgi:acyl transferase domain-containing protein/3-hydroxymyristoyl/3-hydroxydecanoyl-(acyl carrier protein) dehydratase